MTITKGAQINTAVVETARLRPAARRRVALFQRVTDAIPLKLMAARGGRSPLRRLWWKLFKLVDPRAPFRVPVGESRLWVDPGDTIISYALAKHGVFEPGETQLLRRLLSRYRSFVDCGANLGYYSVLAARTLSAPARVFAFEPAAGNFVLLERNIAENGLASQVMAHRLALGARECEAELILETGNAGGHSLFAANVSSPKTTETIRLARLDAVLGDVVVDIIKLDTQGAELDILRGAATLLARDHPLLVMEWWPWALQRAGGAAVLAQLLESFGYVAGVIDARGGIEALGWNDVVARADPNDEESVLMVLCVYPPLHRSLAEAWADPPVTR